MLTSGRRTALPRHQTLRATLDWSYELLPEPERLVMRRLAVFAGDFTAEAASLVAAGGGVGATGGGRPPGRPCAQARWGLWAGKTVFSLPAEQDHTTPRALQ